MSTAPHSAMVLAAGLGLRLRPITETLPKPLVEVGGRSMLDHALDRLEAAGVKRIVVNVHWLADKIEAHLARRRAAGLRLDVLISDERDMLLETGGGVAKALPHLGSDPFFVVNADIVWFDGLVPALDRLAAAWDDEKDDALLLLQRTATAVGYDGAGDFLLDTQGHLTRRPERELAPFLFAGVQILHPRLFAQAPQGAFSLNRLYDRARDMGRLRGLAHDGLWFHVGTPEALNEVETRLLDPIKASDS